MSRLGEKQQAMEKAPDPKSIGHLLWVNRRTPAGFLFYLGVFARRIRCAWSGCRLEIRHRDHMDPPIDTVTCKRCGTNYAVGHRETLHETMHAALAARGYKIRARDEQLRKRFQGDQERR